MHIGEMALRAKVPCSDRDRESEGKGQIRLDGQSPRELVQGSCGATGGGSLERIMHQFKQPFLLQRSMECDFNRGFTGNQCITIYKD